MARMPIAFKYSSNGCHLSMVVEGRKYEVDLSDKSGKERSSYMRSLMEWRKEGCKGYPPLPMPVAL